jgi:integrase
VCRRGRVPGRASLQLKRSSSFRSNRLNRNMLPRSAMDGRKTRHGMFECDGLRGAKRGAWWRSKSSASSPRSSTSAWQRRSCAVPSCTAKRRRYTTDGLTSMFRPHCIAAKVSDFGLRDLRAKGATDEYRAGRPMRGFQHLLGHKSVRTSEIYLKALIPEPCARTNDDCGLEIDPNWVY